MRISTTCCGAQFIRFLDESKCVPKHLSSPRSPYLVEEILNLKSLVVIDVRFQRHRTSSVRTEVKEAPSIAKIGIRGSLIQADKHPSSLNSWYEVEHLRQYSLYSLGGTPAITTAAMGFGHGGRTTTLGYPNNNNSNDSPQPARYRSLAESRAAAAETPLLLAGILRDCRCSSSSSIAAPPPAASASPTVSTPLLVCCCCCCWSRADRLSAPSAVAAARLAGSDLAGVAGPCSLHLATLRYLSLSSSISPPRFVGSLAHPTYTTGPSTSAIDHGKGKVTLHHNHRGHSHLFFQTPFSTFQSHCRLLQLLPHAASHRSFPASRSLPPPPPMVASQPVEASHHRLPWPLPS
ncbi:hypothetical protein Scep_022101 [Stephania cephalantha]|uniref:Uncharacterized protein n=1 Tax=Stephania cephalantha TaxID=152367 RepID=A0AAP0FA89_9MAGN